MGELVRMQVDTALRVFAATLVDNPEAYAQEVFSGTPINKIKDRQGERMTDRHLANTLNQLYPWVESVYRETSELVHFTNRHIFASAMNLDEETRTVQFMVSAKDPPRPDSDYFEVVEAYYAALSMTASLMAAWQEAKQIQRSAQLMTVHKSKGLEAHTVVFLHLQDDAFNYRADMDDEKFMFFVALSRARERLFVTTTSNLRGRVLPLWNMLDAAGFGGPRQSEGAADSIRP
jgi:superfamily I DNA/RNA helicase